MNTEITQAPLAEFRVTCRVDDCENDGIPIVTIAALSDPTVICGPCGQPIAEVEAVEV